jgi:hypothetical protein
VLMSTPAAALEQWRDGLQTRTHDQEGKGPDHDALEARVPWAALGLQPPLRIPDLPLGKSVEVLKLPMSQADRERLTQRLSETDGGKYAGIRAEMEAALSHDVGPHLELLKGQDAAQPRPLETIQGMPAAEWIDGTAARLLDLLTAAQATALKVCTTKRTNPGGQHLRPRQLDRRWKGLSKLRKEISRMRREGETAAPSAALQQRLWDLENGPGPRNPPEPLNNGHHAGSQTERTNTANAPATHVHNAQRPANRSNPVKPGQPFFFFLLAEGGIRRELRIGVEG